MTSRSPTDRASFTMRLRLARAALLWERVWPSCWPPLAVIGMFLVLALFDLLPNLPGLLHASALLGLGAAFVISVTAVFRKIIVPDQFTARRRIELASGLQHRPLEALADRPSGPLDNQVAGLWQAHLRRMEAAARGLRIGFPRAGFAVRDPCGVRALLALLLLIGVVDAGADWRDRLTRAVMPTIGTGPGPITASLDIWVTPPEYTGLAPQFLRPATEIVRIPTGSTLLAQVHGGQSVPSLAIDADSRDFEAVDKQNFQASATMTSGQHLKVTQAGATLGSWPIEIIPDNPPKIAFAKPPEGTAHAALRVDYRASDDYGVEAVKIVIRRGGGKPDEAIELDAPPPGL